MISTPYPNDPKSPSYSDITPQNLNRREPKVLDPWVGYEPPIQHTQSLEGETEPPFEKTTILGSLYDESGTVNTPTICAKIHRGFFKVDGDWTCYRRNYFSVICAYSLNPDIKPLSLRLSRDGSSNTERVEQLGIGIRGEVVGKDGQNIDLVQHSMKRDKGALSRPSIIRLSPHSLGLSPAALNAGSTVYGDGYAMIQSDQADGITSGADGAVGGKGSSILYGPRQTVAKFERIAFKDATANNGKRRAAQQYFHLAVELFAMAGADPPSETQWVKIATRRSAPLVVRGRSPGHYSDHQRSTQNSTYQSSGRDPQSLRYSDNSSASTRSLNCDQSIPKPLWDNATGNSANPPTHFTPLSEYISASATPKDDEPQDFIDSVLGNSEKKSTSGQPNLADPTPHLEDDNSSISSVSNLFSRASFSSVSSVAGWVKVADQLVSLLLDDKGLEALFLDGFTRLDAARFERNLRRLLKFYSLELRREASTEIAITAARFVKARIGYIVSSIRRAVDPNSVQRAEEMETLLSKKVEKELYVEQYLQQDQALDDYQIAPDLADSDVSSLHYQYDRDAELIDHFESKGRLQVKSFIISENGIEELRESLMGFVVPLLLDLQKSASTSELFYQQADVQSCELNLSGGMFEDIKLVQSLCRSIVGLSDALKDVLDRSPAAYLHRYLCGRYGDLQNVIYKDIEKGSYNTSPEWDGTIIWGRYFTRIRAVLENAEKRLERMSTISLQGRYQYQANQRHRETKKQVPTTSNGLSHEFSQQFDELLFKDYCNIAPFDQISSFIQPQQDPENHSDLGTGLGVHVQTSLFICFLDSMGKASNPQLSTPTVDERASNDSVTCDLNKDEMNKPSPLIVARSFLSNNRPALQKVVFLPGMLFARTLEKVTHTINRTARPRVQSGCRRIEWICDCGEALWGDFRDDNPEALAALITVLQGSSSDTSGSPTCSMNNHQPASATQPSVATQKGPIAPDFTASASDAAQLKVCTDHSLLVSSTEKYLELCLNTGEYDVSLAEIAISSAQQIINSDGELFQEIRQRYQKTRGLIRSLNLRLFKPINIHFVEFCFEDGYVGIIKSPLSFPLEKDIQSKEWEFCSCPCPLRDPPPMPANVFLHYFNSKRTHPRRTWLDRLPKKLNHSIHQNPDLGSTHIGWQAHGWGLQIIEGPNGKAMLWLTVLNVLTSLAAALSWGLVAGDVQGACGIGGFMLAALTALVFAFYTYYQVHYVQP